MWISKEEYDETGHQLCTESVFQLAIPSASPAPSATPALEVVPAQLKIPEREKIPEPIKVVERNKENAIKQNIIDLLNAIHLPMKFLSKKYLQETGTTIECSECSGILNCFSKIERMDGGSCRWVCEFCRGENKVTLEEGENPTPQGHIF